MTTFANMPTIMLRDAMDGVAHTLAKLRKLGETARIAGLRALEAELQGELARRRSN